MNKNLKDKISYIRKFNRFYTNYLGVLDKGFLHSEFSLSEIRVLYQIANSENCMLKNLADTFVMDKGYLSRIVKKLEKSELIKKTQSKIDGRAQCLELSEKGKETLSKLNADSDEQIYKMISHLSDSENNDLIASMKNVETLLTNNIKPEDITIRTELKTGDSGYITHMHGRIYGKEYGYSTAFEGYIAQVSSQFLLNYNPDRDRLWCAEHNGKIIGSIAILDKGEYADLRWFLIEPTYRGLGLGKKLLNSAIGFAKEKGYKYIHLVTTGDLKQAMSMYQKVGFEKTGEQTNDSWHKGLKEVEFTMQL